MSPVLNLVLEGWLRENMKEKIYRGSSLEKTGGIKSYIPKYPRFDMCFDMYFICFAGVCLTQPSFLNGNRC